MVYIYHEIKCSSGDQVVTTGSGLVPSPGMEGGLSQRRAVSGAYTDKNEQTCPGNSVCRFFLKGSDLFSPDTP